MEKDNETNRFRSDNITKNKYPTNTNTNSNSNTINILNKKNFLEENSPINKQVSDRMKNINLTQDNTTTHTSSVSLTNLPKINNNLNKINTDLSSNSNNSLLNKPAFKSISTANTNANTNSNTTNPNNSSNSSKKSTMSNNNSNTNNTNANNVNNIMTIKKSTIKQIIKKDGKNNNKNDNDNDDDTYSLDSLELNYEAPKNVTIQLLNNKFSNTLTMYFQYPEYTKEAKSFISYSKETKIGNCLNKNEVFLFNMNQPGNSNKDYCVLYKAYKNVPNCIILPTERNGVIRTTSFLKANLIWKLLKYAKMEPLIRKLNKYQRYNHFPSTWQLGRKDNLWRNFSYFKKTYGKKHFDYLPMTYILPDDLEKFKKEVHPLFLLQNKNSSSSNVNKVNNNNILLEEGTKMIVEENSDDENYDKIDVERKQSNNSNSNTHANTNTNTNNGTNAKSAKKNMFIIKPVASSRGRGIKMMTSISSVGSKCLVSHYIDNPLIINKKKFDLRLYVVITGFAPLKVYLYEEGLVRFASQEYNTDASNLSNKFQHLTNYSINKNNKDFDNKVNDNNELTGSKWSLAALRKYFEQNNMDYNALFEKINDIVVKSCITIADKTIETTDRLTANENCLFELYGFDVLIDSNLRPWLMEVNLNPSLNCDTDLDLKIKSMVMTDLFTLLGLEPYSHLVDNESDNKSRKIKTLKSNNLTIDDVIVSEKFCINNNTYSYSNVDLCLELDCDDNGSLNSLNSNNINNKKSSLSNSNLIKTKTNNNSNNNNKKKSSSKNIWNNINYERTCGLIESLNQTKLVHNYVPKKEKSKLL